MKNSLLNAKTVIQKLPKPSFENFKGFNEKFSIIHEFIIRIAVILGLITLVFFFLKEMTSHKYVLTSIDIAKSIENKEEIYPSDLKQKIMLEMKDIISNSKKDVLTQQSIKGAVSNENTPINFGGFDLNQVFLYFRSFFNLQSREMKVYVMREGNESKKEIEPKNYKVLLSIGDEVQPEQKIVQNEKGVSSFLSRKILEYNAPYNLGLHYIRNEISNKIEIERILSLLNDLKNKEHWWEKIFQNNNWEEKIICLKAIRFNQENLRDYKRVENLYPINPDKNKTIQLLDKIDSLYKLNITKTKFLNDEINAHLNSCQNIQSDSLTVLCQNKIDSLNKLFKFINLPTKLSYHGSLYDWK